MKQRSRNIALLTLVCFFSTQSMSSAAGANIEITGAREIPLSLNIDIPADLATIDELYEAPSRSNSKFILHIQDAHANFEAQSKIKQLLAYLHERYSIDTVFVEGASEKLDADYLSIFQDPLRNKKLGEALAKKGELSGTELYLLEAGKDFEAFGIEDASLYKENYSALKTLFNASADVDRFFSGFDLKLSEVSSKVFSPETREMIADWRNFEKGRREFLPYVKNLVKKANKILHEDLESLFAQVGWPQITRLLAIQMMEKDLNRPLALTERDALVKFLREKRLSTALIESIAQFQEGNISFGHAAAGKDASTVLPRYLLEQLVVEAGPRGFQFRDYPNFSLYAGYVVLKGELDAKALFDEIEYLFAKILDVMVQEDSQKKLLELFRDGELLRKLLNLELNRAGWHKVQERRAVLEIEPLVARLHDVIAMSHGRTSRLNEQVMSPGFSKRMTELMATGFSFYNLACKREDVFFHRMCTTMAERNIRKAVLITGGFHTSGLSDLFRENETSYGIVTPRLSEKSDEKLYRTSMLQNREYPFSVSYLAPPDLMTSPATMERMGKSPERVFEEYLAVVCEVGNMTPNAAVDLLNSYLARLSRSHPDADPNTIVGIQYRGLKHGRPDYGLIRQSAQTQPVAGNIGPLIYKGGSIADYMRSVPQVDRVSARAEMRDDKGEEEKMFKTGFFAGVVATGVVGLLVLNGKRLWSNIQAFLASSERHVQGARYPHEFRVHDVDEAVLRRFLVARQNGFHLSSENLDEIVYRVMRGEALLTILPLGEHPKYELSHDQGIRLRAVVHDLSASPELKKARKRFSQVLPPERDATLVALPVIREKRDIFFMLRRTMNSEELYFERIPIPPHRVLPLDPTTMQIVAREDLPEDVAQKFGLIPRSELRDVTLSVREEDLSRGRSRRTVDGLTLEPTGSFVGDSQFYLKFSGTNLPPGAGAWLTKNIPYDVPGTDKRVVLTDGKHFESITLRIENRSEVRGTEEIIRLPENVFASRGALEKLHFLTFKMERVKQALGLVSEKEESIDDQKTPYGGIVYRDASRSGRHLWIVPVGKDSTMKTRDKLAIISLERGEVLVPDIPFLTPRTAHFDVGNGLLAVRSQGGLVLYDLTRIQLLETAMNAARFLPRNTLNGVSDVRFPPGMAHSVEVKFSTDSKDAGWTMIKAPFFVSEVSAAEMSSVGVRSEIRTGPLVEGRQKLAIEVAAELAKRGELERVRTKLLKFGNRSLAEVVAGIVVRPGDGLAATGVGMALKSLIALNPGDLDWDKFITLVNQTLKNPSLGVSNLPGATVIGAKEMPTERELRDMALQLAMNTGQWVYYVITSLSPEQRAVLRGMIKIIQRENDHDGRPIGNRIRVGFTKTDLEQEIQSRALDLGRANEAFRGGAHLTILVPEGEALRFNLKTNGTVMESRFLDPENISVRNLVAMKAAQISAFAGDLSVAALLNKQIEGVIQKDKGRDYFWIDGRQLMALAKLWAELMSIKATSVAA